MHGAMDHLRGGHVKVDWTVAVVRCGRRVGARHPLALSGNPMRTPEDPNQSAVTFRSLTAHI
jgi:hypothetical protein